MDENIVYFKNILPQLKGIYLHEVWERILRMIARRIHSTGLYPSDWKDFAAEIGINESLVLEDIEISATINKELPLCVAFCGPLQYSYTLYDVIRALVELERADVLCLIREEFQDFWDEQSEKMLQRSAHANNYGNHANFNSVLKVELPKDNLPVTEEDMCAKDLSGRNETKACNCESAETNSATKLDSSESEEHNGGELTVKMEHKDCSRTEASSPLEILGCLDHNIKLRDIHFIDCKPLNKSFANNSQALLKVDISESQTKHHSQQDKLDSAISVFVIYVSCEIRTGIRLANKLREAGLRVITISEAEFMIRIDRSGFLKNLLEKVDFVVPVICEDYMLCVRPDRVRKLNNNDGKTNRFIFTWIHTEYENNACFNFRVKPVIVENFDWSLIGNDPIFQWVHQLWTEIDDLVRLLRDTKQMMKNFVELWKQEEFVEKWMDFFNSN